MDGKRMSQEEKWEIVQRYYTGKSVRELARESGRAASTIYRWLKEFNPGAKGVAKECFTLSQLTEVYATYYALRAENLLVRERWDYEPLCLS